jgi:hypothetical protein
MLARFLPGQGPAMRAGFVCAVCISSLSARTLSASDPTLQEIIKHVRDYEKRTARLEMSFREGYNNPRFLRNGPAMSGPPKMGSAGATTSSTSRVVLQDDLWYLNQRSQMLSDSGARSILYTVIAYDGKMTRSADSYRQSSEPGSRQPERVFRPNTLLYMGSNRSVPFSAFLSATQLPFNETASWKVAGEELVGGLLCVRVRGEFVSRGQIQERDDFWLARDRGFLPIKMEEFRPRFSETAPSWIAEVLELKELKPGTWIPWRMRRRSFGPRSLQAGKPVIAQQVDLTVEKATLDAHQDIQFFRDVRIVGQKDPAAGVKMPGGF